MKKRLLIIFLLFTQHYDLCAKKPDSIIYSFDTLPNEVQYQIFTDIVDMAKTPQELHDDILNYSLISKRYNELAHDEHGACVIAKKDAQLKVDSKKGTINIVRDGFDATNSAGKNILEFALLFPGLFSSKEFETLIDCGANVNNKNKQGDTPLHIAAQQMNAKFTKVLVKHDANVNEENNQNVTPLDVALETYAFGDSNNSSGLYEIVEALISAGATVTNHAYMTAQEDVIPNNVKTLILHKK